MSVGHLAFASSDILKEISSLNKGPGAIANPTMSSMKSGLSLSNSLYPTTTPRTIISPNMAPTPIYNPIGVTAGNDWGLNDLLPSQMGTIQTNPVFPVVGPNDVNFGSRGWTPPSARSGESASEEFVDAPLMYPNSGMINTEMLSLWSEASASFR